AWPRDLLTQLLGKTLGVFGTGKIGARVVALGRALGMEVLAYSARGDAAAVAALGARAASKEDIVRRADVVSLHLRLAPETPEVIRDGLLHAIENVENYLAGKPTDVVVAPAKARR